MKDRQKLDPETRRNSIIFVALAYVALIPIGLQLYFGIKHQTVAEVVMGAVTPAYFAALYVWGRRIGLTITRIRRSRR